MAAAIAHLLYEFCRRKIVQAAANTPPVEYVRQASHVNKAHVEACCLPVYAIPLKGRAANTFDVRTRHFVERKLWILTIDNVPGFLHLLSK